MPARPPGAVYNDTKYPECGIATPQTTPELAPDDEATRARWMNEPASFVVDRLERDSIGNVDGFEPPSVPLLSLAGLGMSGFLIATGRKNKIKNAGIVGAIGVVLFSYSLLTSLKK